MQSNARGMHKSVSSMRLPVFSTCLFVCLYLCVHIFPRPEYFVQTSPHLNMILFPPVEPVSKS